MDSCTHTSPLIDIQPKKTRISMFKRTRTEGRASQLHEFLSSGWYSCNSYAISKDNTPQGFVLFVQFVFSKIKRQILPDSSHCPKANKNDI